MDLRQLQYVLAVAEELNFTRAAARCHVVQSALSHQVARLERELGLQLFERTSRSVRVTEAGETLLPFARRALMEVERAQAELTALSGVVRGRLRLGVIPIPLGSLDIPALLGEFHRAYPGVDVIVRNDGSFRMAEWVAAGELDGAFVGLYADQLPEGLVHHLVTEEPLVAVVAADHPLADRGEVGLAELAEHGDFIDISDDSGLRVQVDAAFVRAKVERVTAFELGPLPDLARYAGSGLGTLIATRDLGRRAKGSSDVAVLRLSDPKALHPIGFVHREPVPTSPAARAFLDAFSAHRRRAV
jgi:DNA-binding transcriptional LysR family regulator